MHAQEVEKSKSPFNAWWFAAAAFLVLVLVGAVFLGFRWGQSGEEEPAAGDAPASEPAAGPDEEEPATGGEDRECGTLSDDQSYPTEAPPTTWETYGSTSMSLPVSEDYGPVQRDGDLWGCYAHSPTGAVYAGLSLLIAFSVGGDYAAAVDTPEAQAAFEEWSGTSQTDFPTFTGFNVDEYTEDGARVSYYGEEGQLSAAITVSVEWDADADDWRLDMTRPYQFDENAAEASFTMWER